MNFDNQSDIYDIHYNIRSKKRNIFGRFQPLQFGMDNQVIDKNLREENALLYTCRSWYGEHRNDRLLKRWAVKTGFQMTRT